LPAYGEFNGPLALGANHTFVLKKPIIVRYIVLWKKDKGELVVNGIKLNLLPALEMPAPPKKKVFKYEDYKGKNCEDDVALEVKGCYQTKGLHNRGRLLVYFRQDIEWGNIPAFATSLMCACAEAAKQHNVKLFGIHFWGECWALEEEDITQDKNGDCLLADGNYAHKCSLMNKKYKHPCLADKSYYTYKLK